jgi:hypothetical protein
MIRPRRPACFKMLHSLSCGLADVSGVDCASHCAGLSPLPYRILLEDQAAFPVCVILAINRLEAIMGAL